MKIVLDTNCLLRSVPPKSEYQIILTSLLQGRFTLCYSTEILMEYEELLLQFYPKSLAYNTLGFITHSPNTQRVTPHYQWNLISADLDDNKFADCAFNGGADYIVTNDKHFNVLKDIVFPSIKVIDIVTFKEMLE